jgi:hypothetical protein
MSWLLPIVIMGQVGLPAFSEAYSAVVSYVEHVSTNRIELSGFWTSV